MNIKNLQENPPPKKNKKTKKENKKLWNMKVATIPIVTGELVTIPGELIRGLANLEIRGQVETTAL